MRYKHEIQIENEIFNRQLLLRYGIKCLWRQVRLGYAGIADIIAYDRQTKKWVIIEVKKGVLDRSAVGQAYLYKEAFSKFLDFRSCDIKMEPRDVSIVLIGGSVNGEVSRVVPRLSEPAEEICEIQYLLYGQNRGVLHLDGSLSDVEDHGSLWNCIEEPYIKFRKDNCDSYVKRSRLRRRVN
tara:strand:+ start:188 stop:733 length:546 start_codon:yes stop_codon:yes gene_type:complete